MRVFLVILLLLFPLFASAQTVSGGVEYIESPDKTVAKFSDRSYGVIYKNNPLRVMYYDADGNLTHTELKTSLEYPYKAHKYSTDGRLINTSVRLSEDETYIYSPGGKLIAHWLNQNCYDEFGKIIMTRKVYK